METAENRLFRRRWGLACAARSILCPTRIEQIPPEHRWRSHAYRHDQPTSSTARAPLFVSRHKTLWCDGIRVYRFSTASIDSALENSKGNRTHSPVSFNGSQDIQLCLHVREQLIVGLPLISQFTLPFGSQEHLQHLPDTEFFLGRHPLDPCKRSLVGGLARIRTRDQPVMSRPLCR